MKEQQLYKFNEFLLRFIKLSHSRMIYPIYRGENLETLYKKLGLEEFQSNDVSHKVLLERLFMIGDKSKSYLSKEKFGLNRSGTFGINDCDEGVLNFIFDTLSDCAKKHPSESVRQFFEKNILFKKFFVEKQANKKDFISSIIKLQKEERIYIRNYYLKLLHQIGSIRYRDKSNIISTSKNHSTANNFSSSKGLQKRAIIHAWEPASSSIKIFSTYSFPKYKGQPYEFQNEISIVAGIFPHYIIGLEIPSTKKLYLNPNIFSNKIDKALFINGMQIDQNRFEEIIHKTNYSSYFYSDGYSYTDVLLS